MDKCHYFGQNVCQEIKDFVKQEYGLDVAKLYVLSALNVDVKPIPTYAAFNSSTSLKVFKTEKGYEVLLVLGYEEIRE